MRKIQFSATLYVPDDANQEFIESKIELMLSGEAAELIGYTDRSCDGED